MRLKGMDIQLIWHLNKLGQILISEVIGIAVTILIVNQLISHQRRKRWGRTKRFFWMLAKNECQNINAALQCWLDKLQRHSCDMATPTKSDFLIAADSPQEFESEKIENLSYWFPMFAHSGESIREFSEKFLRRYGDSIRDYHFRESPAWTELSSALENPTERLIGLTAVVIAISEEPDFASSVMHLAQNMVHLRKAPSGLLKLEAAYDEWTDRLDESMHNYLIEVLLLNNLISGKLDAIYREDQTHRANANSPQLK